MYVFDLLYLYFSLIAHKNNFPIPCIAFEIGMVVVCEESGHVDGRNGRTVSLLRVTLATMSETQTLV